MKNFPNQLQLPLFELALIDKNPLLKIELFMLFILVLSNKECLSVFIDFIHYKYFYIFINFQ